MRYKNMLLIILPFLTGLSTAENVANLQMGAWPSPISAKQVASTHINFGLLKADPKQPGHIYWTQSNPKLGTNQLMHSYEGKITSCLSKQYSPGTQVMNGGGEFSVENGVIYFSNSIDGAYYEVTHCGETPNRITDQNSPALADCAIDSLRHKLYCVAETKNKSSLPQNFLATVDLSTHKVSVLHQGNDFYSSPNLSPDHKNIAWLSWNFPNMPWDQSGLYRAEISPDGHLKNTSPVLDQKNVSVIEPKWSPNNQLFFIADQTGWWSIYKEANKKLTPFTATKKEFGLPPLDFGLSTYAFVNSNQIIAGYFENGRNNIAIISINTKKLISHDLSKNVFSQINADKKYAYFFAGSPTEKVALWRYNFQQHKTELLQNTDETIIEKNLISIPQQVRFKVNQQTAFANFYAPTNPNYTPRKNEKPPLIVIMHGGPINRTFDAFDIEKQFWTSRGYALLDINYPGSTGFGRAYRQAIKHQWGIIDRDSAIAGAKFLVQQNKADPKRLIIRGESAGGYTVLRTMTTSSLFKMGSDYFGWTDLKKAYLTTHKFESHFLDDLIGPFNSSQKIYYERSPLFSAKQFQGTLLVFQGALDNVVPVSQSRDLVESLLRHDKNVVYTELPNEGHGFRNEESTIKCLTVEEALFKTLNN